MEEQQQPTDETKTEAEQPAPVDAGAGDSPKTSTYLERADALTKRMDEGEKRIDEKLSEINKVLDRMVFGGRAEAGQPPPKEKTTEEKAQEMADELLKRYEP